jgi:two-component system C4-dicarboxylate transport sensor histidine kinase DctB
MSALYKRLVRTLLPDSISARLALALGLVAAMTLLAAGLAFRSSQQLEARLEGIRAESIEVLYASARLNELTQQLTARVPQLADGDSNYARAQTRERLDETLDEMQQWVGHLPDYNRYFVEISDQIRYSIGLLHRNVDRRERLDWQAHQQRLELHPLYLRVDEALGDPAGGDWAALRLHLNSLAALAEKLYTDASFNELDYTFLRLEALGEAIRRELATSPALPAEAEQALARLLVLASREGELFALKNDELDLRYQESYLVTNSQRHIQQLAAQISHYTGRVHRHIGQDIERASQAVARASTATFGLSLLSLLLAAAISWFYVRRNILRRLQRLQSNMRTLASGQLETEVVIKGRDEVAAMARDLRHFQQTAQQAERSQRALAQATEERLQAERRLRLAQEELIQAGKLAALGQLSVAITHEINQPLTAMRHQVHSLGRWLERGEPQRALPGLERLAALLDKTAGITRHLRGFARKSDSRIGPVMVAPVVTAAVELAQTRSSHCRPQLSGAPDLWALAEPIRLEQVLVNLLTNALDATQRRASPCITVCWTQAADPAWVVIGVTDNGEGIPAERREHIFDPYFTTKAEGKGLGLGLSISYNIMQDFGGRIRLAETGPEGTRFELWLPAASAPTPPTTRSDHADTRADHR